MDFFKSQDLARKHTAQLVVYFSLAVISLVILTNLLAMAVFGYLNTEQLTAENFADLFDWKTFGIISAAVITVIVFGSLYKILALSKGGASVAEMMGAQLIVDGTDDINKQKVLNVVEEMAIASGTPVPPVYLLEDEEGINAFAAGYHPGDAIVAVTRGTIEKLSRDQLQGVIAHEFSHILNGDMRLNIKLIGILHGILIIGLIGYFLLRSNSHRSYRSSRNSNGGALVALGLGLLVIGYTGTFFGNLIKSAVSRQREYLADASAVQFTRNPDGIASALKRIGGSTFGSKIDNPNASEISHSFFCQGVSGLFTSLFATHPPLDKRIKHLQPNWDGKYEIAEFRVEDEIRQDDQQQNTKEKVTAAVAATAAVMATMDTTNVGKPTATHLIYAHQILNELPDIIIQLVHEPHGARAIVYFLILDKNPNIRQEQLDYIHSNGDDGVFETITKLLQVSASIDIKYRLPLVNLALSTLRQLSKKQYLLFKNNLDALIKLDNKIELFEWALQKIIIHHLDSIFIKRHSYKTRYRSFTHVKQACLTLFSVIIYASKQQNISEQAVLNVAMEKIGLLGLEDINIIEKNTLNLSQLNQALEQLNQINVLMKPQLLKACAACITADKTITPVEAELFRAIADMLDCPMSPLIIK